eukprot:gene20704-26841_t
MRLKSNIEIENGYVRADRDPITSFYLAPERMTTETLDDGYQCILRNIIPIPIKSVRDDIEPSILSAMLEDSSGSNLYTWSGAVITDRNRGVLDNLSLYFNKWLKKPDIKKLLYENIRLSGNSASPYHSFLTSLNKIADITLTGILIEVADSPDDISLSLGAAVLFSKQNFVDKWKLTSKNFRQLIKQERQSDEAKIVDCYLDEAVGMHLASGLPIYIAESLFDRVSINGLLINEPDTGRITLQAPYFDSYRESLNWSKQLEESRAKPSKKVLKVDEIVDASSFLKMRLSEKRACLRASGIYNLPRPREGPKKVDAMMIPLLDEEVAYEVLRRLGETRGDYELASKMQDFETRKPLLARLYNEASRKGDRIKAKAIIDEMNAISMLYYDPNNPDEVISEGFDIEEWYWEQRKRVYGIIAA